MTSLATRVTTIRKMAIIISSEIMGARQNRAGTCPNHKVEPLLDNKTLFYFIREPRNRKIDSKRSRIRGVDFMKTTEGP